MTTDAARDHAKGNAGGSGDPGAGRPPGRPRDEAATAAIREAALRQLYEVGFARMTMEGVALSAGVARATIYRRYTDLADLVTSAISANIELPAHGAHSDDPRRDLVTHLVEMEARLGGSGLEVIAALLANHDDQGALKGYRTRVVAPRAAYARDLLIQAQARGQLAADLDTELAIQMLVGSVFVRIISGTASSPDWAERSVEMIWPSPAAPL